LPERRWYVQNLAHDATANTTEFFVGAHVPLLWQAPLNFQRKCIVHCTKLSPTPPQGNHQPLDRTSKNNIFGPGNLLIRRGARHSNNNTRCAHGKYSLTIRKPLYIAHPPYRPYIIPKNWRYCCLGTVERDDRCQSQVLTAYMQNYKFHVPI